MGPAHEFTPEEVPTFGRVSEDEWWIEVERPWALPTLCWPPSDRMDGDMVAVVEELRGTMPLACVSNGWGGTRAIMERAGVAALFDQIVISAEVGCAKPGREIFQLAASRLGVPLEACVFIDDALDNVETAAGLGMAVIHHTSAHGTRTRLMISTAPLPELEPMFIDLSSASARCPRQRREVLPASLSSRPTSHMAGTDSGHAACAVAARRPAIGDDDCGPKTCQPCDPNKDGDPGACHPD